ncbi:MAG: sodium:proton antiporter [Sphingomonadaceae bacterium]|nr:sodium:proton antiporter [Sphingomonadaceae bacterium]
MVAPMALDSLMVKIAVIGVAGVGAQWIAWRTGRPAIALMLIMGVLVGPVSSLIPLDMFRGGLINPERDFGALMEPIIKLAVAVILFEGGLSLNFRELRHAGWAVMRIVVIGVPVGWLLGTLACHYGAGLSWEVSALFGGILVVTGPTVIGPMLRSLRVGSRVSNILKWEGIVNDPIGALLAVFIFAYITYEGASSNIAAISFDVLGSTFVAALLGAALGWGVTWFFPRGYVPEYLKAPTLLILVIGGFVLADIIQHETGLVTVTIMGVVMANRPMFSSHALRRFKEDLAVLLISGVFIMLSATLDYEVITSFQTTSADPIEGIIRFAGFLLLLLFVVRPLTILISLMFSSVPWNERLFIAWIAPRGIVAVAITGLFAIRMVDFGIEDAEALIPLSFGVVIATIFAHGFTAKWWASRLGIDKGAADGVLLVGANRWTIDFGELLKKLEIPVTVADPSQYALRAARKRELEIYRGDILDEVTQEHLDLGQFQELIAATDNDAYNALICDDLGPEMGYDSVSQIGADRDRESYQARGRVLMPSGPTIDDLLKCEDQDWEFTRTKITEKFGMDDLKRNLVEEAHLLCVLKADRRLLFYSTDARPVVEPGDVVVSYGPPETPEEKLEKRERPQASGNGNGNGGGSPEPEPA